MVFGVCKPSTTLLEFVVRRLPGFEREGGLVIFEGRVGILGNDFFAGITGELRGFIVTVVEGGGVTRLEGFRDG